MQPGSKKRSPCIRLDASRRPRRATFVSSRAPGNFTARHYLGLAKLQRGELEAGARILGQALELKPDDIPARYDLGRALSLLDRHQQARPHFQRLVE